MAIARQTVMTAKRARTTDKTTTTTTKNEWNQSFEMLTIALAQSKLMIVCDRCLPHFPFSVLCCYFNCITCSIERLVGNEKNARLQKCTRRRWRPMAVCIRLWVIMYGLLIQRKPHSWKRLRHSRQKCHLFDIGDIRQHTTILQASILLHVCRFHPLNHLRSVEKSTLNVSKL